MRTQAQANEQCHQVFAQIDTTQSPRGVRRQLSALGMSRNRRQNLMHRAVDLGILPPEYKPMVRHPTEGPECAFCHKHYTMPSSRNKHEAICRERQGRPLPVRPDQNRDRQAAAEERVRLVFKDLDRNRPLAPQARELGVGSSLIYKYVRIAKTLGLIEPDFRFPVRYENRAPRPPLYGPPKPRIRAPLYSPPEPKPPVELPKPKAPAKGTYLPPAHRCGICGYEASNQFRFGKHKCVPDDEDV